MGMSISARIWATISSVIGALTTTAIAPCASASCASAATRGPPVVPPPTPQNTGRLAERMIASVTACCGVNG